MRSINIKDIAKAAGVGVSTVSRVLNNQPDVKASTKEKVLKVIEELNYIPNNSARNLKRIKTNHVGVFVIGEYSTFFAEVIESLEKEISSNGYSMVLHFHHSHEKMLETAVQFSLEKKLVGLIFLGGTLLKKDEGFLQQLNIPIVFGSTVIEDDIDDELYNSVTIDNYKAANQGMEHLLNYGHTKVGLISAGYGGDSVAEKRHAAYEDSLNRHNIGYNNDYVVGGNYSMQSGYDAMNNLLEHTDVTSVFVIADLMAIGAIKAIFDRGLSVPDDVSVVGFDGLEITKFLTPSLTTVEQPSKLMGEKIGQLVLTHVKEDETLETDHIILDTKFIIGQSSQIKR